MGKGRNAASVKAAAPAMLSWQFRTLLAELSQVTLHAADESCPCNQVDIGEYCLAKHLLNVQSLASETSLMDDGNREILEELASEALEYHEKAKTIYCKGGEWPDLAEWSRGWRKKLEPLYYVCHTAKTRDVADLFEPTPIRVTGKCAADTCSFSVKSVDTTEGRTGSVKGLGRVIKEVAASADAKTRVVGAVSPKTFAPGISTRNRYEFEWRVVEASDLVVSHNPFTFELNPKYTAKIQPRIRERAANQLQVRNIAANLDPDKLLLDFHAIDTGSPIVGEDLLVECGNGRVMALLLAAKEHPAEVERYKLALKEIAPAYALSPDKIDKMKVPVLVRVRLNRMTGTQRQAFAEECNARPTMATSAIENARTDADKITPAMLGGLDILEGEAIEDALRSGRNKRFTASFLAKLPENEQSMLVDAHGVLSQDGVRRMAMAVFVATFKGSVGIRLASNYFESIEPDAVRVFNGIMRSLGALAQSENLVATKQRESDYAFGEDLARAVEVYSSIKKSKKMTVPEYLAQQQLEVRELTPFQERILQVLDENSRSAKRIGMILSAYAEAVTNTPPPGQAAFIPEARPTKEQLFESAVRKSTVEVADLFAPFEAKEPWQTTQKELANQYLPSGKWGQEVAKGIKAPTYMQFVANHRESIRQALKNNLPVPAEVLKDYPDLAKQAPAAPEITPVKEYGSLKVYPHREIAGAWEIRRGDKVLAISPRIPSNSSLLRLEKRTKGKPLTTA